MNNEIVRQHKVDGSGNNPATVRYTPEEIRTKAGTHFGVTWEQMRSRESKEATMAMDVAVWISVYDNRHTVEEIAEKYGLTTYRVAACLRRVKNETTNVPCRRVIEALDAIRGALAGPKPEVKKPMKQGIDFGLLFSDGYGLAADIRGVKAEIPGVLDSIAELMGVEKLSLEDNGAIIRHVRDEYRSQKPISVGSHTIQTRVFHIGRLSVNGKEILLKVCFERGSDLDFASKTVLSIDVLEDEGDEGRGFLSRAIGAVSRLFGKAA